MCFRKAPLPQLHCSLLRICHHQQAQRPQQGRLAVARRRQPPCRRSWPAAGLRLWSQHPRVEDSRLAASHNQSKGHRLALALCWRPQHPCKAGRQLLTQLLGLAQDWSKIFGSSVCVSSRGRLRLGLQLPLPLRCRPTSLSGSASSSSSASSSRSRSSRGCSGTVGGRCVILHAPLTHRTAHCTGETLSTARTFEHVALLEKFKFLKPLLFLALLGLT